MGSPFGRLATANQAAVAADRADADALAAGHALAAGDTPGSIVRWVRQAAAMPAKRFRTLCLAMFGGIIVCQTIVAALAGQSRNVRAVVSGFTGFVVLILVVALAILFLGRYVRVSIATFRRIAFVTAVLLGLIILGGSAVRLTGSGLGCPDWPTCKAGKIVPESGRHAAIEFGNRVVTGLCLMAAAIGVLTALVRRPYRRDLVQYGLLVSAGLFGNAILGGLTVIFHLQPEFVMSHFLLAAACLAVGAVLFHRSGEPGASGTILGFERPSAVDATMRHLGRALIICTLSVVFVGCVLTGSGPHGGDPEVRRFGFSMLDVVRIHSGLVWITMFLVIAMAFRVRRASTPAAGELRRRIGVLALVIVGQGAIGYWQWFTQVPALLVQFHVLGAVLVWAAVLWVRAAITLPTVALALGESAATATGRHAAAGAASSV